MRNKEDIEARSAATGLTGFGVFHHQRPPDFQTFCGEAVRLRRGFVAPDILGANDGVQIAVEAHSLQRRLDFGSRTGTDDGQPVPLEAGEQTPRGRGHGKVGHNALPEQFPLALIGSVNVFERNRRACEFVEELKERLVGHPNAPAEVELPLQVDIQRRQRFLPATEMNGLGIYQNAIKIEQNGLVRPTGAMAAHGPGKRMERRICSKTGFVASNWFSGVIKTI